MMLAALILAQAEASKSGGMTEGLWLAIGLSVVVAVTSILSNIHNMRRKPTLDRELSTFATRAELERLKEDVHEMEVDIGKELKSLFKELDAKRSESIGNLHAHLTSTKEEVAATGAKVQTLTASVAQIHQKIDSIRTEKK